jgi:hypothetical protein
MYDITLPILSGQDVFEHVLDAIQTDETITTVILSVTNNIDPNTVNMLKIIDLTVTSADTYEQAERALTQPYLDLLKEANAPADAVRAYLIRAFRNLDDEPVIIIEKAADDE